MNSIFNQSIAKKILPNWENLFLFHLKFPRMKSPIITFLLCLFLYSPAQNMNIRKAIQKSDLIFENNDNFNFQTIQINDYTKQSYVQIIKSSQKDSILKNKLSSLPELLSLRVFEDNEDYFSDSYNCACILKDKTINGPSRNYNIFFVRKVKGDYEALLILQDLEWEKYNHYVKQINTMASVEKIKNPTEKFQKTLDWFIENGLEPDEDFIQFYKEIGITSDTIQYSENQYQKALQQFQNGNEDLFPIVKQKFPDKLKEYYLQKMENIIQFPAPDHNDYFEFYKAVNTVTNYFGEFYDSTDYILNNSLTEDDFDEYEKRKIMEHLVEVVKEWKFESE